MDPDDPAPAVDERERLEARGLTERCEADQAVHPAAVGRDRLLDRRRQPDRLEHEVRTAIARRVADALDCRARIGGIGLDPVRRPERAGEVDLRPAHVDRHDPPGTGQHGAHHARQPDPAETDHRHRRAGRTSAVLITAPTPVETPQPISAATWGHAIGHRDHGGRRDDLGRGHRADREVGEDWRAVGAGEARRAVGLRMARDGDPEHSHCRPRWHSRHRRQGAYQDRATDRPMADGSSPAPTASMTPAPSCPSTIGPGRSQSPSRTWRSEWHTPDAVIRTRTSPGRGSSSRSVSTVLTAPARSMTAASIPRMPLRCPIPRPPYPVFWRPPRSR